MRIRTLLDIIENSNLIIVNVATKRSNSRVERQIFVNVAEEEIWVDIREDSNLIIVNMATKCSHSGVEEKI